METHYAINRIGKYHQQNYFSTEVIFRNASTKKFQNRKIVIRV